jgi:hypothetical protein
MHDHHPVDCGDASHYLSAGLEAPAARRNVQTVKSSRPKPVDTQTRSSRSCGNASAREFDRSR